MKVFGVKMAYSIILLFNTFSLPNCIGFILFEFTINNFDEGNIENIDFIHFISFKIDDFALNN